MKKRTMLLAYFFLNLYSVHSFFAVVLKKILLLSPTKISIFFSPVQFQEYDYKKLCLFRLCFFILFIPYLFFFTGIFSFFSGHFIVSVGSISRVCSADGFFSILTFYCYYGIHKTHKISYGSECARCFSLCLFALLVRCISSSFALPLSYFISC